MKRILCVVDSLSSGGAQRQMVGLATFLKENKYVVKVVTYYDLPFYKTILDESEVENEVLNCGVGPFSRLFKLGIAIKKFEPDVVISFLNTPNILTCILKVIQRRWKLIVSERNTTQELSLGERAKFYLYRFADAIVSNSYSQEDFICTHYPKLARKSTVITNFVDTNMFSPSNSRNINDQLRIIGVGRIAPQKNIPILIEAVRSVVESGYKVRVDWYGKKFEACYEECMKMIELYGLKEIFRFHEPFNPIVEKYRDSDLFVLPSIYEGFPNVLCEAISCGLPVVASDVCDNGRIVHNGKNGFLFPSGDIERLRDCILSFYMMNQEDREVISAENREYATQNFSATSFVRKYIHLIEKLR